VNASNNALSSKVHGTFLGAPWFERPLVSYGAPVGVAGVVGVTGVRAPSKAMVGDGGAICVTGVVFTPPPATVGEGRIPATTVMTTLVAVGGGVM